MRVKTHKTTTIKYAGVPAELSIYQVSTMTFEMHLSPLGEDGKPVSASSSSVKIDDPRKELWKGTQLTGAVIKKVGDFTIRIGPEPLAVTVEKPHGKVIQEFSWKDASSGSTPFRTDAPVYGLGEGGIANHLDRRGFLHPMKDGNAAFQLATHGAYIAVPMLVGADGWSTFFHQPIDRGNFIDLRNGSGNFLPTETARKQALQVIITC